jgi:hypothetical protein
VRTFLQGLCSLLLMFGVLMLVGAFNEIKSRHDADQLRYQLEYDIWVRNGQNGPPPAKPPSLLVMLVDYENMPPGAQEGYRNAGISIFLALVCLFLSFLLPVKKS